MSRLSESSEVSKITVIIPALNEEKAIGRVVRSIPKEQLNKMGFSVQTLVIDNGSEDRTAEIARMSGAEVIFEPRRGYGRAYKAGFANAIGDLIATVDADMSYPANDIPKLAKLLIEEDLDFVTTNRFSYMDPDAMSLRNIIGNVILNLVTRLLYGIDLKDSQSGMWLFKRALLDRLICKSDNMSFSQEIKLDAIYYNKCRWQEVPIRYRCRVGEQKLSGWSDGPRNLLALFRKRIHR